MNSPPDGECRKLYLVGSLRNETIPVLAASLRKQLPGVEVFDDWYAAGPEADDYWKSYEKGRGRTYEEALEGYAAKHVFAFDKHHLDTSSHVLLVLPAGKSGHMEVMYAEYGTDAKTAILLEKEERWDVMYQFIPTIIRDEGGVVDWVSQSGENNGEVGKTNPERDGSWVDKFYEAFPSGRGLSEGGVSYGGRPARLLPECSCRGCQTL